MMRTSVPGCEPGLAARRALGFTLIEIVAACAVAAIALGVVMIRLDFSDGRRLRLAAELLAGRLEAARDEAVMRGQAIAFSSDGQGFQFWIAERERNAWVALSDTDTVAAGRLADGVSIKALRINGGERPLGERLVFSFGGLSEAFTLTLAAGTQSLDIAGDALGRIEIHGAP
ncbi:MAG: GspH/FimT family pseudopilin [Candidatus Accumulibacter sp.]|jgi:type II secretion system protein H|nr:GspH/FimT family pseudopilin [Accumulibacter sp.]